MLLIAVFALYLINLTQIHCQVLVGTGTNTTEHANVSYSCNGYRLKGITRDAVFPSEVPCTGLIYGETNDTFQLSLSGGRNEMMTPETPIVSAYMHGYQLFVQFGQITKGTCTGGFMFVVAILRPITDSKYRGCLSADGLKRAESFYAYTRVQGGQCQSDCTGSIQVYFEKPVYEYNKR